MHELLKNRVSALMLPTLRALRSANEATMPIVADEKASGTWLGMSFAHPTVWAARGAGRNVGDVAVIPIMGALTLRGSWMGMSLESIRQVFRNKLDDTSVRAIVLEYDSPGGDVFGIEELAAEFRAARGIKPIFAVANPLAASAAMYLAAQADQLFVTPSGQIGSIGVYGTHEDWSGALDQFGVKITLISAGEGKTDGNPWEPLSEEAQADIQADVNRYYQMFVAAVAKGRKASPETIRTEWKAKMYGAKDAVANGMADGVATLDDTIRRAAAVVSDRRSAQASVDAEVAVRQRSRARSL